MICPRSKAIFFITLVFVLSQGLHAGGHKEGYTLDRGYAAREAGTSRYSEDPALYVGFARDYALAGKSAQAARELERAIFWGFTDFDRIKNDRDFASLRRSSWWRRIAGKQKELEEVLALYWEAHEDEKAFRYSFSYDELIERFDRAAKTLATVFRKGSLASRLPLFDLGMAYQIKEVYEKAHNLYDQSLETDLVWFSAGHQQIGRDYAGLGDLFYDSSEYSNATRFSEKALPIVLETLGEYSLEAAKIYENLGAIFIEDSELDKARYYLEKSLEISTALGGQDHPFMAYIYPNLALLYGYLGEYDRALFYAEQALRMDLHIRKQRYEWVASDYNYIGIIYDDMGEYDLALENYQRGLAISLEHLDNYSSITARIYGNIGFTYKNLGNFPLALQNYIQSLEIEKKIFDTSDPNIAGSLSNIGNVYLQQGDYAQALAYYQQTLAIDRINYGPSHYYIASDYKSFAAIYLKMGDREKSMGYAKDALVLLRQSLAYLRAVDESRELAELFYTAVPAIAREALETGIDAAERGRQDIRSAGAVYLTAAAPFYYLAANLAAEQKRPAEAFGYSEALRQRGFLEQTGLEAALRIDGIRPEEADRVRELSRRVSELREDLLYEDGSGNTANLLRDAERELEALHGAIGNRLPKYRELRDPRPMDAASAAAWCPPDTAVLEYLLPGAEDGGAIRPGAYCLVVRPSGVTAVPLDGGFDYEEAVNLLRERIGAFRSPETFEGERNALYEKLLAPVLAGLGAEVSHLLIVPDGPLAFLPFDLLRPSAANATLGSRYSVSFSPSLSITTLHDQPGAASLVPALALGEALYDGPGKTGETQGRGYFRGGDGPGRYADSAAEYGALTANQRASLYHRVKQAGTAAYFRERGFSWVDLPGTAREIETLARDFFLPPDIRLLRGADAGEGNLKRLSVTGELKNYSLIHLSCHGYFDSLIPEMSGIVLSEVSGRLPDNGEDGYLTVTEAALLDLRARILILSACDTGLTRVRDGDGMVGLLRAFLVAGANNVGASLWPIDDDTSVEFMTRLYTKLIKENLDFRRAYGAVKRELQSLPQYSHPYYWAGFTLYE
ncbi:CHAT domain-containing tetratricopeptide repeat protein [Treponema primitia]|uniref:CHAT domain-containing tetratricopeptide repeat protein n=1 Tax=Treponema primitia TaxID=88058 RepID=UPI0002555652|nr:CHAT domain-containing tetratricopeptide repeat protein [Treponema primitia]